MWRLINLTDGKRYPITEEGLTIGREGCTVPVPTYDIRASRRHAGVRLRGNRVEVEDNGSTNGTFLGSVRVVDPMFWTPGIVLRCGDTRFELAHDEARTAPAPTPADSPEPTAEPTFSPAMRFEDIMAPSATPAPPAAAPEIPLSADPRFGNTTSGVGIGLLLLGIGLLWWRYLAENLWPLVRLAGDSSAPSDVVSTAQWVRLLFTASIILTFAGGIVMLAGVAQLLLPRLRFFRHTPR